MAHEKLSPRQKMIGMMYLVLTAMLALNVSKEAVKAFMRVEQGLKITVNNYVAKNAKIYNSFDALFALNPAKYKNLKEQSSAIKQRADELYDYMQHLKIEIINKAEGPVNKAVKGNEIFIEKVERFDENNIPSQILIGAKEDGKAFQLRTLINSFRDDMLELVKKSKKPNVTLEESLKNVFNTSDVQSLEKTSFERWENANFQTLPLVAVVAILSKLQVDVRNAETDILSFLYEQIDAATPRFNKLEATVIANNFVMQGSEYEAQVFLTASDSTLPTRITLGNFNTTTNSDGSERYVMTGDTTNLPVDDNGKGTYKVRATTLGPKPWGGVITVQAEDGSIIQKPFKTTYVVGEQSVVVSPSAMNVLYASTDNPIGISIPGVGSDKIRAAISKGTMEKGKVKNQKGEFYPGEWKVMPAPETVGQVVQITVGADFNGKFQPYGVRDFRVKPIPKPVATFANASGDGKASKPELLANQVVFANLEGFDFDLKFKVTEFRMGIIDKGFDAVADSKGQAVTKDQVALINKLVRGAKLYVTNIKAVGPDNKPQALLPIIITVN